MMSRPLLAALACAALIALSTGCGSDSSSSAGLADLAPPKSVVYIEGNVQPSANQQANIDAISEKIGGIGDLGQFLVEELESSSEESGEPVDFEKEIEPWLGERAALVFQRTEDGDLTGAIAVAQSTDAEAAQSFVDGQVGTNASPYEDGSYQGIDYKFGGADDNVIGIVDDRVVMAEGVPDFEAAVDAAEGESLADEDTFDKAIAAASDGSLADVYVDVGELIEQGGGEIDPQARQILRNAGIDPSEATAVASVIPGSDQITVELSSDLAGQEAPTGDASELLGSLPGNAFAGFAVSGFGKQLQEAVDSLDEEGIPDTIPPGQLKKGLKELGIDLEALASSIEDAAAFASGTGESSLGGALVLSTKGSEATDTIANIGMLLRQVDVAGVTALSGKYSGFSVRSEDLGDKPLVVAAKQGRLAIGYGLAPTVAALASGSDKGESLADDPAYSDAVASLGDTPIGGFANGPAALRLADALIPSSDSDFEEAKKYLKSIRFLALGSASQEDLATAKLIVGLK